MRLIDADELKKKLKLWAFNNVTTTSPTFDFVTEFDIDECQTVDVLDKIRADIETKYGHCDICEYFEDYDYEENDISEYRPIGDIADILQIIDTYKGDKE